MTQCEYNRSHEGEFPTVVMVSDRSVRFWDIVMPLLAGWGFVDIILTLLGLE